MNRRRGEESSSKKDFRRLVVAKIRNRLFGNNNLVHSTENSASVGTMLSYVGSISVSAFFRISRWTTRDQIATRLRVERETKKEKKGASIFSSEEWRPANSLQRLLLSYAQCVILCVLQRARIPCEWLYNHRHILPIFANAL